jgi:hypothetical protein
MSDPSGSADPSRPSAPRLDRAPGERYRGGQPPSLAGATPPAPDDAPSPNTAIVAGVVVAILGALLFALLSQVDLGFGLVAIAMFVGWAVALALVWNGAAIPRRAVIGAILGAGAIVVGLLLAWGWGRLEGGALDPLAYVNERFGVFAYLEVLAAGAVAWYRSR